MVQKFDKLLGSPCYDHKKVKDYNLMIKVEKKFLSYLI